jgi:hypothetical protein
VVALKYSAYKIIVLFHQQLLPETVSSVGRFNEDLFSHYLHVATSFGRLYISTQSLAQSINKTDTNTRSGIVYFR